MAIDTISRALGGQASKDAQNATTTANQAKEIAEQAVKTAVAAVPAAVTEWLDDNVDPVGSAVMVDKSLTISGDAADAKVTGDAIRAISPNPDFTWTLGKNVDGVGNVANNNYTAITNVIKVQAGDIIVRKTPKNDGSYTLINYINAYIDEIWQARTQLVEVNDIYTVPDGVNGIIIGYGRTAASGIVITQSDIDSHFDINIYRAATTQGEFNDLAKKSFVMHGNILSLGYSSCAECSEMGAYTFYTAQISSITDLPPDITSGGLLKTYKNESTIWQEVETTTNNYIRYSLSGAWYNRADNIKTSSFMMRGALQTLGYTSIADCSLPGAYTFTTTYSASITDLPLEYSGGGLVLVYTIGTITYQELMNTGERFIRYGTTEPWVNTRHCITVSYNYGSGSDNSIEQLNIDVSAVRTYNEKIRYQMGHCVDADNNCNVWRLMYLYKLNANNAPNVMTRRGEFECALHLDGRDDFSGGYVHGDEIDQNVTFIADGNVVAAQNAVGYHEELCIIRNSVLYDPSDHSRPIALHGVEYIFNRNGLRINQSVKWLVAESLTNCYLAMFPLLKTYSTYRYDDTSFIVTENPASGLNDQINDCTSVTEYGNGVRCTMHIERYPEGLPGGDCALVTDNGGIPYNKIYFVICNSGNSQVDELWKSSTIYSLN